MLLRWQRELVARKWNHVHKRKLGRPRTIDEVVALILRMASVNPGWGCWRRLNIDQVYRLECDQG